MVERPVKSFMVTNVSSCWEEMSEGIRGFKLVVLQVATWLGLFIGHCGVASSLGVRYW